IAREAPWRVHLLHVLPASLPPDLHVASAGRAQEALAAQAEALARHGVSAAPQLGSGLVAAELVKAAAAHDLIVLGARGQDVLRDFATGRTALRVVRESRRPVLLVKHAPEGPYRRAVAAVDFSEPSFHAAGRGLALAPG